MRRGVRLGVRIGLVPALLFGPVLLLTAVARLWSATPLDAVAPALRALTAIGGSLAVGVLLGAVTGGVLALAPQWVAARAPLRGLLAGAVASAVFLAETVVVAVATDVGYAPVLLTLLATPVAGAVAAAHSGDVLGRTRYHAWLWQAWSWRPWWRRSRSRGAR